jgi:hypothetical protein
MGRLTELQQALRVAAVLDRPLKPYQLEVARPLAQRDGDGYRHRTIVVLLPRQVGKTFIVFCLMLARMHTRRAYAAAYTAQTGIVVTRVFTNPANGWMTLVAQDPRLARRFSTRASQGREMVLHRHNLGAYLAAFPPTPGRLRSMSLDCVTFDECQEHTQDLGQALMADTGPTFSTRPRRQHILMGTAPESGAGWWADQIARGRAGDVAMIEVGTWPDDEDPADPATWARHHPGLMTGLTDVGFLSSELDNLGLERFAREYGNRIPGGASLDTPLVEAWWKAAKHTGGPPPSEPVAIAFDAAADGAAGCVVGIGRLLDGRTVTGVAAHEPGTAWMAERLKLFKARHPRARLVTDSTGPAAPTAEALRLAGLAVETVGGADRVTAHSHLVGELEQGRALLMPHPALEDARAAGRRRWTDSGGWVWSRRRSAGDISPITAWTWAVWAARKPNRPRPAVRAGRPAIHAIGP